MTLDLAAIRARAERLTGYTEGRWNYDCECVVFIRTGEGMHDWQAIATVEDEEIPGEEALANTAIMTAAPDLRRDVLALCEHDARQSARIEQLEAGVERLRSDLDDLVSWFDRGPISQGMWLIPGGAQGVDDAVEAARATLKEIGCPNACVTPGCTNRPVIRFNRWHLCRDCYGKLEFSA